MRKDGIIVIGIIVFIVLLVFLISFFSQDNGKEDLLGIDYNINGNEGVLDYED